MKRVTGIGGIFFKAKDAPALPFGNRPPGNDQGGRPQHGPAT